MTPLKKVSRRPSIPRPYRLRNNSRPHLDRTALSAATPTDHVQGIEAAHIRIGCRAGGDRHSPSHLLAPAGPWPATGTTVYHGVRRFDHRRPTDTFDHCDARIDVVVRLGLTKVFMVIVFFQL